VHRKQILHCQQNILKQKKLWKKETIDLHKRPTILLFIKCVNKKIHKKLAIHLISNKYCFDGFY
jgi:hypothetical protein